MQIERGILIPSTLQKVGKGVTGASYAIVIISGVSHRCVVKRVSHESIASECLCAILGNALGLPTLAPVIVIDPETKTYLFGAKEVSYPDLSSRLNEPIDEQQIKIIANLVANWNQSGSVISFDELIENGDRNPGNILFDGEDFILIDHERALRIDKKIQNKLAFILLNFAEISLMQGVERTSITSAMSQQALLSAEGEILHVLEEIATELPEPIEQYYSKYIKYLEQNMQTLVSDVSKVISPLFAGRAQ